MPMKQAMIFAAGLGTRLKPLTDTMPKALVKVGGEPLLWHVVMKLKAAGFERIVVNVHHFADQIEEYIVHGRDCRKAGHAVYGCAEFKDGSEE